MTELRKLQDNLYETDFTFSHSSTNKNNKSDIVEHIVRTSS